MKLASPGDYFLVCFFKMDVMLLRKYSYSKNFQRHSGESRNPARAAASKNIPVPLAGRENPHAARTRGA
jgi:hypothetical protein